MDGKSEKNNKNNRSENIENILEGLFKVGGPVIGIPTPVQHLPLKIPKLQDELKNLLAGGKICSKPTAGPPVYCNLADFAEHTGIYIGNHRIIHLNGDGIIEEVSPEELTG